MKSNTNLGECDDAGLLAEVELAGAEEVEHAVEVARLAVEAVLVEVGVVPVGFSLNKQVTLECLNMFRLKLERWQPWGPIHKKNKCFEKCFENCFGNCFEKCFEHSKKGAHF